MQNCRFWRFSRRVWCCAEPVRLRVSVTCSPPPSRPPTGLRVACLQAAVAAGQSSRWLKPVSLLHAAQRLLAATGQRAQLRLHRHGQAAADVLS
jgi:hypothetical protein